MLVRPLPELVKENARVHGDKPAYEDDSRAVTWCELEARTARLAVGLGVGRGDRVALLLGDGVDLVEALLAVTRASAVGVLISPHSTDAELAALIADCAPALVVTDRERPALGHDRVVDFESLFAETTQRPRDDLGRQLAGGTRG